MTKYTRNFIKLKKQNVMKKYCLNKYIKIKHYIKCLNTRITLESCEQ